MEFSIAPKGLSTKRSYSGITEGVNLKCNSSKHGRSYSKIRALMWRVIPRELVRTNYCNKFACVDKAKES